MRCNLAARVFNPTQWAKFAARCNDLAEAPALRALRKCLSKVGLPVTVSWVMGRFFVVVLLLLLLLLLVVVVVGVSLDGELGGEHVPLVVVVDMAAVVEVRKGLVQR